MENKQVPITGSDLDSDELRIAKDKARFIKGLTFNINRNPNSSTTEGGNVGVLTPMESNLPCAGSIVFPGGINRAIGFVESKETKQAFCFVWNSNNNHFIYRINGVDGTAQIVYKKNFLNFQNDPRYYIPSVRCAIHVSCYIGPDGTTRGRTILTYTDAFQDQRYIAVEDSIATNSFDPAIPFFNSNGIDTDQSEFIKLGVPTPLQCIGIFPVERTAPELLKPNIMIFKGWQFRIKFIDVWGRESEHGIISDKYFTLIGSGCISESTGLNRCVDLVFDAGYPLVDKIQIEFRTCSGNNQNLTVDSDWFLYDTIDKYDNSTPQEWWERPINNQWQITHDQAVTDGKTSDEIALLVDGKLKYDSTNNTFRYRFCGDKECIPLPVTETGRVQNQLPLKSNALFNLDRGIGLAGNTRGFEPLDVAQLDKIDFTVTRPTGDYCPIKVFNVDIYGIIWNPFLNQNSQTQGHIQGSSLNGFGVVDCNKNNPLAYDQTFPEGVSGWIGYMAGTRYNCISVSMDYDPATDTETIDVGNSDFNHGHFQVQKWSFKLPPGKYVFRIAAHRIKISEDYQRTSTYVVGRTSLTNTSLDINFGIKEIVIEVTNADVLIKSNPIKIWDLMRDARDSKINLNDCWANATTLVDAYLYEDRVSRIPIEMAAVTVEANNEKYCTNFTDHNGFFFGASKAKTVKLQINSIDDCATTKDMFTIEAIDNFNAGGHLKHDELYVYDNPLVQYPDAGRRHIKGKITLCDKPTVGIAGVAVIMTKGAWGTTNSKGEFNIIAHQRYGSFSASPANQDNIIISQRGDCKLLRCDIECDSSFPDGLVVYKACGGDRVTNIDPYTASIQGTGKSGPQTGGRYGGGIVMHDWMGRQSFVQGSDKHYMDIPSLVDIQKFDFCQLGFTMDSSIRFPSWVRYVSFYITDNLNFDDFLSWAVDRFQFIDNSGNVNNAAPTKIRIYYGSLGGYNTQNNLATNTNWQFLAAAANKSVTGDKVEFIMNGDGTWYSTKIEALVVYDKTGTFFTIDYNDDLKGLLKGALIRLIRPKQCINKYIYFEQCPIIKVTAGVPETLSGTFNYFDSYFLNRQLPVPVEKIVTTTTVTNPTSGAGTGNGSATGANDTVSTDPNANSLLKFTGEYLLTAYPFLFEHPSPSDFWGDHCANRGRVNTKNPLERQYCIGGEIALSKVITDNSNTNGLNYFDIADATTFDTQDWGKIMAVMIESSSVLVICENNSFIAGFNDNTIRISSEKIVEVGSLPGKFGKPSAKVGKNYGCQLWDINTIQRHDGVITFLDRNKELLIIHYFSDATDVSKGFGFSSWLSRKIAAQNKLNNDTLNPKKCYFIAGVDPKTGEYYLTDIKIAANNIPVDGYINNLREVNLSVSETIIIDIISACFKGFAPFTPEYYGGMDGYFSSKNMFTMKMGVIYGHHNGLDNPTFLNFYGVQTKKVIQMITNIATEKVKRWMTTEVYCKEQIFIADEVKTESGQVSRILLPYWDMVEGFSMAAFLCDLNTPLDPNLPVASGDLAITEGDVLYGRWISVRYISQDADDNKYCEISAIVTRQIASERSAD